MKMYKRTPLRIGAVVALVAISALGLKGANAEHRAHLSLDLLTHQSRHTPARTRVIVRASVRREDALDAARGVRKQCFARDSAAQ